MTTTDQQALAVQAARSGGLAAFTGANNPFTKAAKKEGVSDGLYLRMNGKTGAWLTNAPGMTELEPETELVFDLYNCAQAWQGFDKDNKLHNGPSATIASGAELPDHPDTPGVKWGRIIKVMTAPTDGGKQMLLTCKANNQYREIWKLVKKYGELLTRYPDPTSPNGYMSPIVKLSSRSYEMPVKEEKVRTNPQTGAREIYIDETKVKNFSEILEIVDWITTAEMEQQIAANGDANDDAPVAVGAPAAQLPAAGAGGTGPVGGAQQSAPVTAAAAEPVAAAPQPAIQTVAATVEGKEVVGEVLPPPAGPTAAAPGFRRGRAGVRTA